MRLEYTPTLHSTTNKPMADETSNAPQDDDSTKRETIRITLPPKTDQPAVKRETVRINVPGATDAPKKETSKITLPGGGITPPPPPSTPPTKQISSAPPAPKPPPLTGKPTVPLRPAPPAPSPSGSQPPPPSGIVAKPVSPKKETARITLPSEAPKVSAPALPKATVKMQQTQPLAKGPTSGVRSQPLSSVSQVAVASGTATSGKPDTGTLVLSIVAFLAAAGAAFMAFNIYSHTDKEQHGWTNHVPYVK
jgi:hypothetical protein